MGTSPSGLQSPQTAPQQSDTPSYSPSQMAGQGGGDPAQSGGDSKQAGMAQLVNTFTGINAQLVEVSKQFPFASKDIRTAADMLRSVLKRIMSNPGMAEPPAPQGMA